MRDILTKGSRSLRRNAVEPETRPHGYIIGAHTRLGVRNIKDANSNSVRVLRDIQHTRGESAAYRRVSTTGGLADHRIETEKTSVNPRALRERVYIGPSKPRYDASIPDMGHRMFIYWQRTW